MQRQIGANSVLCAKIYAKKKKKNDTHITTVTKIGDKKWRERERQNVKLNVSDQTQVRQAEVVSDIKIEMCKYICKGSEEKVTYIYV